MVSRVTDVKPLVAVATYTCEVCSSEIFQEVRVLFSTSNDNSIGEWNSVHAAAGVSFTDLQG